MIKYYHLNGRMVPVEEAILKVNDLAILRGYGIFDFFLIRRHQPLFIEDYLDRFYNSANKLHLQLPLKRQELKAHIQELIKANGQRDGSIRLLATGGYTDDGYTPVTPNLLIMQYLLSSPKREHYDKGIKLMTYGYQRDLPEVKTINYLQGIRLLPELRKARAMEPLYHDHSIIRETVRANIFFVTEDDRIITPGSQILYGITRRRVLELTRNYFEVEERDVHLDELPTFKEAFVTGSNKRIMPVVQIDDHLFGDGEPGVITQRLMELLEAYTVEYLTSPVR